VTARQPLRRARAAIAGTPLRIKLVGAVLVLTTAGLAVAGFATTTALHRYLLNRVDDQLRIFATHEPQSPGFDFDDNGGPGLGPGGPGVGTATGPDLPSQFYVAQFLPDGRRQQTYRHELTTQSPPKFPLLTTARAIELSRHAFTVSSVDGDSSWRVVAVVSPTGLGSTAIATSLTEVNHTVQHVMWLETAIGLVALVFIGIAGYLVINRSLRPLVSVEHTAAAIAAGDLSQRVPEHPARTEVGQLSIALNAMLAQIEDAFAHEHASEQQARASEQRMRRFVADASHELRTPLTSIRGFAELFRMGAADAETDLPRLMKRIEDEAARMGLLVEDLLLLARMDQQRPLERAPVDLLTVVTDAVHDAQLIAPDRAITLTVAAPRPPTVTGDESRLRQVVSNLVGNALTHTPAGTPVEVGVRTVDDNRPVAIIDVSDRGPGVAEEQARQVFERFYRADTSRSRVGGGSGLGLSIVASLVAAHGGTVAVTAREGGGATFSVTIPLADDRATDAEPLPT
jgi:two-component system OmpR family sensor kinase